MKNREVIIQVIKVAVCELVGTGIMIAAFLLLGKFSSKVLIGGMIGWLCSVAYFFMLSVSIANMVDKAANAEQDAKLAGKLVGAGSTMRLLAIAAIMIILIKSGICDPLATIIPLLFIRPSIMLLNFFTK